jgi:hypothetical protein
MPKIMRYILVTFLSFWKKICFVSVSFLMVEKFNGFPFLMNPKFNGTFLIRAFFIKKMGCMYIRTRTTKITSSP